MADNYKNDLANQIRSISKEELKTLNIISVRVDELKSQSQAWEAENKKLEEKLLNSQNKAAEANKVFEASTLKIKEILELQESEKNKFKDLKIQTDEQGTLVNVLSKKLNELNNEIKDKTEKLLSLEANISQKSQELADRMEILGNNEKTLKDVEEELSLQRAILEKRERILSLKEQAK